MSKHHHPQVKHNLFKDRDIILSTIFVFLFIGFLKISFIHIPHMDPINAALEDFEISDIVYQFLRDKPVSDAKSEVVVVGIGNTREEIAHEIRIINSFGPKVIALDAYFLSPKNEAADSVLLSTFSQTPNLVVGSYINAGEGEEEEKLEWVKSFAPIDTLSKTGFVNFLGEENKTIRLFKPQIEVEGEKVNSFDAEIVKMADKEKYNTLIERDKEIEFINYRKSPKQFTPVLELEDVRADNEALAFLKDKIVLIGSINSTDLNDLHFTPMNARIAGRSKPDMPGVFVHANILEMILNETYINKIPDWVVFIFSILLTYVSIVYYTRYFVEKHIWYHLMAKITQFVFTVVLLFLEIILLSKLNIRFSDKIILIPIVLSVDLLYFYDAFVKWLNKRFGYHTYFIKSHS